MGTYELKEYWRVMQSRKNNLRKVSIRTPIQAALNLRDLAISLAPFKTGETIAGIRVIDEGEGKVSVISDVPGSFKQNMFANQTAPFRTLRFGKNSKQPYFATPQNVVYGREAVSPSGKPIRWTGTPRFFHIATLRVWGRYRKLMRMNTRQALKVSL